MAKNYDDFAKVIIEKVGGTSNINSLTHCVTRLRFKLKDEKIADTDFLKKMDGVVTVMQSGGQYQVVIGNHVPDVYAAVCKVGGIAGDAGNANDGPAEKQGIGAALIDTISGVFAPTLGVLCATGMLKGLLATLVFFQLVTPNDGFYRIIASVADGFFYFLPVMLGYSAAKKFGLNLFTGLALGSSMIYLQVVNSIPAMEVQSILFEGSAFQMNVYTHFLGIPITWPAAGYASSVVPIILSVYAAAKIEKFFKKVIPDVVKTFLVPMFTLLIATPLVFILIGPIASLLTSFVSLGVATAYNFSPVFAGLLLGAFWQVLVIFGLHWGVIPIGYVNLAEQGFDQVLPMTSPASFSQSAVVLAMYLKTKDQKLKNVALPAFISGMFGVTEPAIYGVTLPKKKPFIISCIGAAVGGAMIGLFGIKKFMPGGLGVFSLPNYINPETNDASYVGKLVICWAVAMAVSFVLTWITYKDDDIVETVEEAPTVPATKATTLIAPLSGKVMDITEVEDAAFSSGALGKGVAIQPTEGVVVSPVDGTVATLFKTNHAIGLITETGAEILIHIGMDTVQLDGKHFTAKIAQGDKVVAGQPLVEFDIAEIEKAGYSVVTPVVITNSDDFIDIVYETGKVVKMKDELMQLL